MDVARKQDKGKANDGDGEQKKREWLYIGPTAKELREEIDDDRARDEIFLALREAAAGLRPSIAKDWKGQGSGVWELAITRKDAHRCVILIRYADVLYVCAAFKKKSHEGRKTPTHIVDKVNRRIAAAEADYKRRQAKWEQQSKHGEE